MKPSQCGLAKTYMYLKHVTSALSEQNST